MQSYRNAVPESREFKMRIIELVAASLHQIGVLLFQSEDKLHTQHDIDAVVSWDDPAPVLDDRGVPIEFKRLKPRPTLFYHINYMDHDQYPNGLADVAGYWAEDRILGGIAVFDRGRSGTGVCRYRETVLAHG